MSDGLVYPHAIIITEHSRPTSIWMAGVLGVKRLKLIELDPSSTIPLVDQALKGLKDKLASFDNPTTIIPAFGKPLGVVINLSPDEALKVDLQGEVIEKLDRAVQLGSVRLTMDGARLALSASREK